MKLLGNLNWDVTPFSDAINDPSTNTFVAAGAASLVIIGAVSVLILLTWFRLWRPLWRDWLTSADHKRIGVMYIVLALVMLARGVAEGAVMRGHQAMALNGGPLSADHFSELFSTHGTIMILFVAMPLVTGLINIVVPLQIGARDMAFPVMNQVSLGLTAAGAALIMVSLVIGRFETGGWTAYPPYTGKVFSPGEGPDYWIWSVVPAGLGSMLSGINFAVTIYKCRAPGMTYMRMPLFTWTALCTAIMMIYAMPPVTVSSLMLALDRYAGFHFFSNDLGGNMMNYANIFWMFGHPEVYILVLPAYGVWSEVAATFSAKQLYGYVSLVTATMSIAVISFTVWLHHFFTMGQSASVNIAFGIATMIIAVPTGVKVYDWMATLWRGRIRMTVPVIYLTGFFILFVIGGLTGVILANPTIDYQVHNTLFLVAHFHNVLIPGVLFGMLAGIHYWFPKVFGFRLDETWGARAAGLWVVGFCLTFLPLYVLGLMGMPRRSPSFTDPAYLPMEYLAAFGAVVILGALAATFTTYIVSIRHRKWLAVPLGDPWDGRTLEWATPAPVPEWNFAVIPEVSSRDAFALEKEGGTPYAPVSRYADITLPRRTTMGLTVCVATTGTGFALVWHIWWLVILCFTGLLLTMIARAFATNTEQIIPAAEVARQHRRWLDAIAQNTGITRDAECTSANRGLAAPDEVIR
ncbi:cbb3-type cytochrome c oxidase subunit I [Paracoccus sp. YLB-12]|uniref:Cbb3-type cytochrome c oxidase subunit I n=1 Tax=Paracoccus maritimus TaxID=2933292 RepID=A0ABT2KEE0_9RHOB|nr:cbb3-type cytochrome c oxidase subunit I [Paracoccus sp. YLB-12]MCT4334746.1 cbb3-type cytochrome c oxidase subunit I [Paracoccus sp. YLB-12]